MILHDNLLALVKSHHITTCNVKEIVWIAILKE